MRTAMNGYSEAIFTVEKSVEIMTATGKQTLQVRVDPALDQAGLELQAWIARKGIAREPQLLDRYIAISGSADLLLLYQEGHAADLESDWQRLIAEPEVRVSELLWYEVVEHHSLGRRKDGFVVMY